MSRRAAAELYGRSGLADLTLKCMGALGSPWLTVLAYHRVCDDAFDPWDRDIVSATPEMFIRQLQLVTRYFAPVTSAHVVDWLGGRASLPRNPVLLTFDDGYRDNHDIVLPLLLEAGVVADFFVCPWHIENRRLFWWDVISFCVGRCFDERIALSYPHHLEVELGTPEERVRAKRALLSVVKRSEGLDIPRFVGNLQEEAKVEFDERQQADDLLMTWDHVRTLQRAGMGVGSHSYSHPVLPLLGEDEARFEIEESKGILEKQLGSDVTALAYPVGALGDDIKEMAKRAGYGVAYSYCSGASMRRFMDPFEIGRVAVEKHISMSHFRTLLATPFLACSPLW